MIIGISGKAGAGKDTVGKIIQHLTSLQEQDCSFEEFHRYQSFVEMNAVWKIKKFATAVKQICSIFTDLSIEDLEDEGVKQRVLGQEWSGMTVREMLQKIGTEAIRNNLHPEAWVNSVMSKYYPDVYDLETNQRIREIGDELEMDTYDYSHPRFIEELAYAYPSWVITDLRFKNEAEAIKKRKGSLVRVERKGLMTASNHISEIELDGYEFDYVIQNDGTIQELIEKVKKMLKTLKLY